MAWRGEGGRKGGGWGERERGKKEGGRGVMACASSIHKKTISHAISYILLRPLYPPFFSHLPPSSPFLTNSPPPSHFLTHPPSLKENLTWYRENLPKFSRGFYFYFFGTITNPRQTKTRYDK